MRNTMDPHPFKVGDFTVDVLWLDVACIDQSLWLICRQNPCQCFQGLTLEEEAQHQDEPVRPLSRSSF